MTKEFFALAESYKRMSETMDGKVILDDLRKAYCKRSVFAIEPHVTSYLEGHRDVVLRMERMIEVANDPQNIEDATNGRFSSDSGTGDNYFDNAANEHSTGQYI